MNSVNRRQRRIMKGMLENSNNKQIDKLMKRKIRKTKKFERQQNEENYDKHLDYIRKKYSKVDSSVSPNGGKPPFKKPID